MTFVYGSYLAVNACLITVSKDFSFTVYLTIVQTTQALTGLFDAKRSYEVKFKA